MKLMMKEVKIIHDEEELEDHRKLTDTGLKDGGRIEIN